MWSTIGLCRPAPRCPSGLTPGGLADQVGRSKLNSAVVALQSQLGMQPHCGSRSSGLAVKPCGGARLVVQPCSGPLAKTGATEAPLEASHNTHVSKKRRRMNKELKMFDRHVKMVERRQQFTNQWVPIETAVETEDQTTSSSSIFVVPSPHPLIQIINNTTPIPISTTPLPISSTPPPTPLKATPHSLHSSHTPLLSPSRGRRRRRGLIPLPPSSPWDDATELVDSMLKKEAMPVYMRDSRMFVRQFGITARMRTILLDWIMEVCEAFKLKRDTYHTCVDLLDRYISRVDRSIHKNKLQLIGVTALYIASKVEESQPLKTVEVSFVTDRTCSERDILAQELDMLKAYWLKSYDKLQSKLMFSTASATVICFAGVISLIVLNWSLSPLTVVSWLTMFLQVTPTAAAGHAHSCERSQEQDQDRGPELDRESNRFMIPEYTQHAFLQMIRLLDLCLLDADSFHYPYSILAATALYYSYYSSSSSQSKLHAESRLRDISALTGYQYLDLSDCVDWMRPFVETLEEAGTVFVKFFKNYPTAESHNIQTHAIKLSILETCQRRRHAQLAINRMTPNHLMTLSPSHLMTLMPSKLNINPSHVTLNLAATSHLHRSPNPARLATFNPTNTKAFSPVAVANAAYTLHSPIDVEQLRPQSTALPCDFNEDINEVLAMCDVNDIVASYDVGSVNDAMCDVNPIDDALTQQVICVDANDTQVTNDPNTSFITNYNDSGFCNFITPDYAKTWSGDFRPYGDLPENIFSTDERSPDSLDKIQSGCSEINGKIIFDGR